MGKGNNIVVLLGQEGVLTKQYTFIIVFFNDLRALKLLKELSIRINIYINIQCK